MSDPTVVVTVSEKTVVQVEAPSNSPVIPGGGASPVVVNNPTTRAITEEMKTETAVLVETGPQGPPGPSGDGFIEMVSGESLNAVRGVYHEADDDRAHLFDAGEVSLAGKLVGITKTSASGAGQNVQVVTSGELYVPGAGFTPEAPYFAQAGGLIGTTPPSSGILQQVGVGMTASKLLVNIGPPTVIL